MTTNQPSWLSKQYFIWTSSIGYDIFYPQGTMTEELIDSWIHGTVPGDWAEACMQSIKKNEYSNPWWDAVDLTNKYDHVHGKSAFWAGWYDIFLVGNLAAYNGYNTQCQEEFRYTSKLTIDPLGHCQSAAEYFPQDLIAGRTLLAFMQAVELYDIHSVARTNVQNVTFYVMSSNDDAGLAAANYWTSMDSFPTPKMTDYYFHSDKSMSTSAPTEEGDKSAYVYDPANPVPTVGGNNLVCLLICRLCYVCVLNLSLNFMQDMPCGPLDQAEIDQRSDVLTFETPALAEALPLTGPLDVTLFVGSDAVDTDFMVRLSDVYPTGEVRLIQDSAIRMRWREGGQEPVYMSGDSSAVYEVTGSLWNTSYVLAPGHSVRVAVTSSNYPRFSANPNNGKLLRNPDQEPIIVANNILHHSAQYPSRISLPVVDMGQLPKLDDIKMEFRKALPNLDPDEILKGMIQ
jgi:predicted acyl esterase